MKARSRWEHDPVLTRTLGTVGRLSGGPEERRSEDSIHTQMDSRGGLCSSNPWPYPVGEPPDILCARGLQPPAEEPLG